MFMEDTIKQFLDELPEEVAHQLDFTPESLDTLEGWLLSKYYSPAASCNHRRIGSSTEPTSTSEKPSAETLAGSGTAISTIQVLCSKVCLLLRGQAAILIVPHL